MTTKEELQKQIDRDDICVAIGMLVSAKSVFTELSDYETPKINQIKELIDEELQCFRDSLREVMQ